MKKLLITLFVLAILLTGTVPALAAEGPTAEAAGPRPLPAIFTLTGVITAIDSTAETVTVKVWRGNWVAKPHVGQEVTLSTLATTRFLFKAADCTVTPIAFEDLAIGQQVSVRGRLVEGVWRTWRITVRNCPCTCP
jgi:hypothetical protein